MEGREPLQRERVPKQLVVSQEQQGGEQIKAWGGGGGERPRSRRDGGTSKAERSVCEGKISAIRKRNGGSAGVLRNTSATAAAQGARVHAELRQTATRPARSSNGNRPRVSGETQTGS